MQQQQICTAITPATDKTGRYPGILQNRKEKNFVAEYTAIVHTPEGFKTPVTLRIYETQTFSRACIWVHAEGYHTGAGDNASGYGYHKASTAAGLAIKRAGIKLAFYPDGQGDEAIQDALEAIARFLYPEAPVFVHKANG